MKTCKQMTRGELRRHIQTLAAGIAARTFQKLLPNACEEDAWHYANRHWQHYRERAVTLAAVLEVAAEDEGASLPLQFRSAIEPIHDLPAHLGDPARRDTE